ncbi:hypothetical protein bcgnr5378_07190 [Bacillus cereus]|uniref:Uncharacterized protein n=1 Tax=Bacillus cereus TaxID=1396 RepID=A0A164NXP7_BACCE|nr:hypothetical protein [Bacillus cereus]KZD65973.1 hypothetical protein B4088_2730 [Bacillus cereus]
MKVKFISKYKTINIRCFEFETEEPIYIEDGEYDAYHFRLQFNADGKIIVLAVDNGTFYVCDEVTHEFDIPSLLIQLGEAEGIADLQEEYEEHLRETADEDAA